MTLLVLSVVLHAYSTILAKACLVARQGYEYMCAYRYEHTYALYYMYALIII